MGASSAAVALAMALCLVVNRILRRQFALAQEREALMAERAMSLSGAERLAKSKSQILATLSHEIRNGLTGITHVLAAAAGAGGRAAPSREQLSAALASARELLEVLDATLDTETAGAGRLTIAATPFDAAALARATVLLHRPKAAARHLELDLHIDDAFEEPSAGAAIGDAVRTRQILATWSATPSNTLPAAGSRCGSISPTAACASRWPTPGRACRRGAGAGVRAVQPHRAGGSGPVPARASACRCRESSRG